MLLRVSLTSETDDLMRDRTFRRDNQPVRLIGNDFRFGWNKKVMQRVSMT